MSIIVPLIMLFVCSFVPVLGYALYRSWRLVQLEQFLGMSKVSERLIDKPAMIMAGITTREAAEALTKAFSTKASMRDYQPEQCSFTQYNDDGFAFPMPVEETK